MRRGRGEGSVFRRRDGLWVGMVTVGYADTGRRKRRAVYGRTKAEVLEKLVRLRHAALTGTLGDPARLTVASYLARWLDDAARPAIRESTYKTYEGLIRVHVLPRLGGVALARLTPAHIQGLLADMERVGRSGRLRLLTHQVLHRALRQAVEWGMIPRNPADAVVPPRPPRPEMRTLTPEQARRFLDVARGDRLYALYAVLVGTGMRLGEALGLGWPDVDLDRGTLTVRRQLCEVAGRVWLAEPKTAAARRTVTLPGFVVRALREHQARMEAEGRLFTSHLLVFVDSAGNPLRKSNIRRRSFEPLLRAAGLPRIRLHDLRHTAATLHLLAGTPPRVVQEMLGHSHVAITLGTYSHVLPTMQREAAARMDTLLATQEVTDPNAL
ncbi:MAG: site-specific integrase [Armatimonadota bacterium]|nr:site-specific integrase [Armatimonadota bacterium]MDR7574358.1 site-specific integrase [Armatimonadota bacterium]